MPKQEVPMSQLQDYLPPGTYEPVLEYLRRFKVHLTVARERKSILGDYRHRTQQTHHRISVNGNLNNILSWSRCCMNSLIYSLLNSTAIK